MDVAYKKKRHLRRSKFCNEMRRGVLEICGRAYHLEMLLYSLLQNIADSSVTPPLSSSQRTNLKVDLKLFPVVVWLRNKNSQAEPDGRNIE